MEKLRSLFYRLSPTGRQLLRKVYYLPIDLIEHVSGRRNKYVPPRGDIYIGSGDFVKQGNLQLGYLKNYLNLQSSDCVLDIGCGIGRTAVALTNYLNDQGSYWGFDVVEKGIEWCKGNIAKDFPNFHFEYIPLRNDLYNDLRVDPSLFEFPFPDNYFDKVFLFSVFTHMQTDEIDNYLKEIKRVLKPNGLCLATFFVYNEKNEKEISTRHGFCFPYEFNGYRLMNMNVISANIAINEWRLNELISDAGLKTLKYVPGYWNDSKRKADFVDFQDIIVLSPVVDL